MTGNFKGIWIPKEILCNKNLGQTEKLLISSAFTLDKGKGCFATNGYFSELIGISKDRVSKVLNKLIKSDYITSEIIYKTDTKEVEKRILSINFHKCPTGICGQVSSSPGQNAEEREHSVKSTNKSRIFRQTEERNTEKQRFDEKSNPYLLAEYLENQIKQHTPEFKQDKSRLQSWAKDIDLMIRKDKLDPDRIAEVIRWSHESTFWRSNILSGKKLREKYLQLSIQMNCSKE